VSAKLHPSAIAVAGVVHGRTHAHLFALASVGLIALLAAMWLIVALNTLRQALSPAGINFGTMRGPKVAALPRAA